MARKHEDTKFRGMWSPKVGSPAGYAFKFLPTAPAQKPKTKANAPPPDPVFEGYIDEVSGQVGSRDEEYLGCIRQDNVIENAAEEKLGDLDLGKAIIKSTKGNTIAEIDGTGSLSGHGGSYLGQFEPFGYKNMKVISVYLLLLDPGMLNEVEG